MKARWQLTDSERLASTVLSNLRYNKDKVYCKCLRNDIILWIARKILGGRDPIEFIIWTLDLPESNYWAFGDYKPKES